MLWGLAKVSSAALLLPDAAWGVVTSPEKGTESGSQKHLWARLGTQGITTGIVDGWAAVSSLSDLS